MPQIHHYHPDTGLYLGSTDADESPLEPGVYLIPANSTLNQPPQPGVNQSPVFSNNQWALVPDYRGYRYWLPDGSEHTINVLGEELPIKALTEKPPKSPELIKEELRRQLQHIRDTALQAITHDFLDGRIVQVRPQDLSNFQLAISYNVAREWVMADNSVAMLTVAEMQTAMGSGIAQGEVVWDNYIAELKLL